MARKSLRISLLALVVLAAALGACTSPYQIRGSLIDPALPAPPIELLDSSGQPFSLDEQTGKIVLLFFGYTSCPDVCPTTLADLKQTLAYLEADEAEKVQVVFVTRET